MRSKEVLKTTNLTIGYDTPIVRNIDVSLYAGQMVCLIGPNGAGKSTLLKTLTGIQKPFIGGVSLLEENVHKLGTSHLAKHLSIVLTEQAQMGLLSGYELVELGRYPYTNWMGLLSNHDRAVVQKSIDSVGATNVAHRKLSELSDGERQKLMIARALAQEPEVMILDEPTAYLDAPRRMEIMWLLRSLSHKSSTAILLSTHDLDLALRLADVIWLLPNGGPLHVGIPEDLVLNGSFESAFEQEGAAFDPNIGTFKIEQIALGRVTLVGDGLYYIWTKRALEREGFAVNSNGHSSSMKIEIVDEGLWCLYSDNVCMKFETLAHLLTNLKQNSWVNSKERV